MKQKISLPFRACRRQGAASELFVGTAGLCQAPGLAQVPRWCSGGCAAGFWLSKGRPGPRGEDGGSVWVRNPGPDFVLLGNPGDVGLWLHRCLPLCQHGLQQAANPGLDFHPLPLPCSRFGRLSAVFLSGVIFADHQLSPTLALHNLLARFKKRSCIKCV